MSAVPQQGVRRSPLEAWHAQATQGSWLLEDMRCPQELKSTVAAGSAVTLTERSWRRRLGLKGPAAEAWLAASGLSVPAAANSWALTDGILVGRLATAEFLVEAMDAGQQKVLEAAHELYRTRRAPGVYPVIRQDLVVHLAGSRLPQLLRQTCSVDYAPLFDSAGSTQGSLVLTSMIGVSVVAIPLRRGGVVDLVVWTDPSFAHYFWTTLVALAADLGGGVALDRPTRS